MVLGILALAAVVGSLCMVIVGLAADKQQSDTVTNIPDTIDFLLKIVDDISDLSVDVSEQSSLGLTITANITSTNDNIISEDFITAINETLASLNTTITDINDITADAGLDTFRDDISNQITDYEDQRHLFFVIALAVLIVVVALQGAVALMDWCAPCKPKRSGLCRCLNPVLLIISFILTFILWILAAVLVVAATGTSDFCIEADANVLSVTNLDTEDVAVFLIRCDEDNTITHPYRTDIDDAGDLLDQFVAGKNNLTEEVRNDPDCGAGGSKNATCQVLLNLIDDLGEVLDTVVDLIGNDTDSDGIFDEGALALLECDGLNSRYQRIANTVCDDMATSVIGLAELFIAFAVLFLAMQFLSRLLSDSVYTGSKIEPDKGGKDEVAVASNTYYEQQNSQFAMTQSGAYPPPAAYPPQPGYPGQGVSHV